MNISTSFKVNNESYNTGGVTSTGSAAQILSTTIPISTAAPGLFLDCADFIGANTQMFAINTDYATNWRCSGAAGSVSGSLVDGGIFSYISGTVLNPFSGITTTGIYFTNASTTYAANPQIRILTI